MWKLISSIQATVSAVNIPSWKYKFYALNGYNIYTPKEFLDIFILSILSTNGTMASKYREPDSL